MFGRKERIAREKAAGERRRRWFGPREQVKPVVDQEKREAWLAIRNSRRRPYTGHIQPLPQHDPRRRKPKRSRWVSAEARQKMADSTRAKRAKADSVRMRAENARDIGTR